MLNRVTIMGRFVADPELRHTQTNTAVTTFRLAVERDFKDKSTGERATDWINCVAWRQTAEFISRYFAKGRMAVVEGKIQTRSYKDKEGNNRSVMEVIADNVYFADSQKKESGDTYGGYSESYTGYQEPAAPNDYAEISDDDGEMPF